MSAAAPDAAAPPLTLVVRRTVRASAARLFEAWTDPGQLRRWWGPPEVACIGAEIDLKVGGHYRIGNAFADGSVLWISGAFERIEPPRLLVYTWCVEPAGAGLERVTIRFDEKDGTTDICVIHERIADPAVRASHERGWNGCLDGLAAYAAGTPKSRQTLPK